MHRRHQQLGKLSFTTEITGILCSMGITRIRLITILCRMSTRFSIRCNLHPHATTVRGHLQSRSKNH